MVERAICNRDKKFFTRLSNAIKRDLMNRQTQTAKQWLLVTLLWFLGGKDIKPQRKFLQLLKKEKILLAATTEASFNFTLYAIGLTTT